MILSDCISREQEVYRFLLSCVNPLSVREAQAFMDNTFDPETMFCYLRDGQIQALLQTESVPFTFMGKKTMAFVLSDAFYARGCRARLDELIESAALKGDKHALFTVAKTADPSLYRKLGFGKTGTLQESRLLSVYGEKSRFDQVRNYDGTEDLYPLYRQFLSFFDGSLQLSEAAFDARISQAVQAGKKVMVCGPENAAKAFAVLSTGEPEAVVETLVYSDPGALLDLLLHLESLYEHLIIRHSRAESLGVLAELESRPAASLMIRLTSLPAFNRWQDRSEASFEDAFSLLEKPSWNFLF